MDLWHLGESRNVYATVTAETAFTVVSSICNIYQISSATTLAEAILIDTPLVTITDTGTTTNLLYAKFTPTVVGIYVALFTYTIGTGDTAVTGHSLQTIHILETM